MQPSQRTIAILALSFLLGVGGLVALWVGGSDAFVADISLGTIAVCLLPWLLLWRRRLWSKSSSDRGGWMSAVMALLWLAGPIGTVAFGVWSLFSFHADGLALPTAYSCVALALLIQMWRDQWRPRLTGLTIAYLFLVTYLPYSSRIRRDTGLAHAKLDIFHGESVCLGEDTDVALARLSTRERNSLMTRLTWLPVRNHPWYEGLTRNGSPGTYGGIPWYRDLVISVFSRTLAGARGNPGSEHPLVCTKLIKDDYHYDLVLDTDRSLLWIVSYPPVEPHSSQ